MKTHVDFLDPISLTSGKLPLDSLLDNSVYYPASGYDGDLIRLFNKILTEKGPIASSTVIMHLLKRKRSVIKNPI